MLDEMPTEIKIHEYRCGLVPGAVREYVANGHQLLVQTGAGNAIGADDDAYLANGATIAADAAEVLTKANMIIGIKEPQSAEWAQLREGQILFAYLHLAPDPEQTKGLAASGTTCVAHETVVDANGGLPLIAPMSKIAGPVAIEVAATSLRRIPGGLGLLIGGVPGVQPARSVALGGGVVGAHAGRIDGIIHYCVANMPGAVSLTSSHALNNATLPYGLALAADGLEAIASVSGLMAGLNVHRGRITNRAVADSLGTGWTPGLDAIAA